MTPLEYLQQGHTRSEEIRLKAKWVLVLNKYGKLKSTQKSMADEGILRYFEASDKVGTEYDYLAPLEIINDAIDGRQVWKESIKEFVSKENGTLNHKDKKI